MPDVVGIQHGAYLITKQPLRFAPVFSQSLKLLMDKMLLQDIRQSRRQIHASALAILGCRQPTVGEVAPYRNESAMEIQVTGLQCDRLTDSASRSKECQKTKGNTSGIARPQHSKTPLPLRG
jgi:hypothetical protein